MRYLLYGFVGLIALVVGAAAIGPAFVDWNSYKDTIAAEVFDATGRTLEINGDLALSVLPSPRLSASDVRLTSRPGAGQADMARLGALRVHVRLIAPAQRRRRGHQPDAGRSGAGLRGPKGRCQQLGHARQRRRARRRPRRTRRGGPARAIARSAFDRVRVENGSIVYRNVNDRIERKLEKITADTSADSVAGPFKVKGDLISAETPMDFEAAIGSLANRDSAPVELLLSTTDDPGTRISFKGRLSELSTKPRIGGAIEAKSTDLSKLAAAATGTATDDKRYAAWQGQPFELKSRVDASADAFALNDLSLNLAGTRATGAISVGMGEKTQLDIALKAQRLDVDKLQSVFAPAPAGTGQRRGAAPTAASTTAGPPAALSLPKDLGGSVDVAVESMTVMGGRVRGLKLKGTLAKGAVTINQATALFPGGARAAVVGTLTAKDGKPIFNGKVDARARSLRETLDWLKIDVGDVSRDRLRKFQFVAKVRTDASQIQVTDIDLALDATKLKGGVTYALRDRPSFGASIALDQINLDAYLPRGPDDQPKSASDGKAAAQTKKAATAPAPMAILNDFDANLAINVGSVTYRRTPIQGLRLNGTLLGGKMTLREAAVRSLGGARLGVAGTLTNFAGFPAFKGTVSADAKDPAGLFRVLGVAPIQGSTKVGRLKLAGKADADEKRLIIDTKLNVVGGELSIAGSVADYREKPTLNLTLKADHPDYRRLAATFGTELPAAASRRLQLVATVKGPPDVVALKSDIRVIGGTASIAGQIKMPVQTDALDLTVSAKHPDFIALMRTIAPDYRPAAAKVGEFTLATRLQGGADKIVLDKISAAIGPTTLSGTADLALDGPRPSLTANLTASDLLLDPLLPAEEGQTAKSGGNAQAGRQQQSAPAPAGQFSREPIDVAVLDSLDAKVVFAAKSLTHRKTRVDAPRLEATLKDKVLTVAKLEGKVFDGTLIASGMLNGTGIPAIDGKVTMKQASLKKALFETADIDLASGVLDLDLDLKGAGRSEHDLVASLNGVAKIGGRDGVIKGFDLPAVSDRLKQLNRTTDILSLFAAGMGGGSTKFSRLDGTFQIKNGVARTTDTKMIADAGEGTAVGTIDLPKWLINMDTKFRLSEHDKAPAFGMRLRGQLDEPRRIFQFKELQAFLLRRSVSRILKDVLPVEQKQPAAPAAGPAPTVQPAAPPPPTPKPRRQEKIKPEEILRGLLQGLQQR